MRDLNNAIDSRKPGFQLMTGIDAQGSLGLQHPDVFSDRAGPAFLGKRDARGFVREVLVNQQIFGG